MPIATVKPTTGETGRSSTPTPTSRWSEGWPSPSVPSPRTARRRSRRGRLANGAADLLEGEIPDIARNLTTEMGKTFVPARGRSPSVPPPARPPNTPDPLAEEPVATSARRSSVRDEPMGRCWR